MSNAHAMPVPLQILKRFWVALTLVVIVAAGAVHWFQNAFDDRGYAPEQPIAFYHNVHAGELGIDCKYCHFNADRGKHPGVPPMSVCLGCHQNNLVTTANPQYQAEINKLLKIASDGSYEADGVVHEGGVVHWKRVHKLPDHVYFSHQWHVRAGVACQTCHGPVEQMTVMRQHSDLTMAWCLECHRRTNYVGGRRHDPADPATFAVGTGDREAQRHREIPDDVVEFVRGRSSTDGAHAADAHATHAAVSDAPPAGERDRERLVATVVQEHERSAQARGATLPPELRAAMQARIKDLPIWRLADLPETHRAFYQDAKAFQNAPTQCNTCHQ